MSSPEIYAAVRERENQECLRRLDSAISQGSLKGRVGDLKTGLSDFRQLDEAIKMAMQLQFMTSDVRSSLDSAITARKLRAAVGAGEWEQVQKLVHEAEAASKNQKISVFVDIVETEIIRASQETKNYYVKKDICYALQDKAGKLSTNNLEHALETAQKLQHIGAETKSLCRVGSFVLQLRKKHAAGDWAGLEVELLQPELAVESVSQSEIVAAKCNEEVEELRRQVHNNKTFSELKNALASGMASVANGGENMLLSSIDLQRLDAAILRASSRPVIKMLSPQVKNLLDISKSVLSMRSSLQSSDPAGVQAALNSCPSIHPGNEPIVSKELSMTKLKLSQWSMMTKLRQALTEGAAQWRNGVIAILHNVLSMTLTRPSDRLKSYIYRMTR